MRRLLALAAASAALAVAGLAPSLGTAAAPYELNIGSLAPDNTPWRDMLVKVERHVESKSAGQLSVIIRPPGLMAEVEMARETRKGERLQAAAITTAALAEGGNIPELQLIELPFLFDTVAQADHVLDNVIGTDLGNLMSRRGFVLGLWSENGWRSFGTKKKPVRKPEDLAGLKMRSQESDVHMAMWAAFGATAVQKPTTEVLTALQSNVIDGLDNTALYALAGGLADPLDYWSVSKHVYQPAVVVYSRTWYSALPENLQKLLLEPKGLYQTEGRKAVRAEDVQMIAQMPALGLQVVTLTDAERTAFAAKGRAMHRTFAATIEGGTALYDKIQTGLKTAPR